APGLYLAGWLGSVGGLAIVLIGLMATPGGPAPLALVLTGLTLLGLGLVAAAGSQALERRARRLADAAPSPVLVFGASASLAIVAGVLATRPLVALGIDPRTAPLGALVGIASTAVVYVGLVRLLVVGTGALDWRAIGLTRPGPVALADLAFGIAWAVPILWLSGLLAALLSTVLATPEPPLPLARDPLGLAANLVAGALIAPIGEEIFFRGYATTAWARRFGARHAIVRGALFFAFAHVLTIGGPTLEIALERAAFAFVVRLPVALALGWVFLHRRSLYASIGLHAAFNGIPLVVAGVAP
ncbi:MAG TPA: type II CAAX endopeptidase family protein, partial [Candidatus Limnocylindrales bacterium]|nr:type II CAAX endopeptidase family protein [Candidatus Limnocylindrales bacterium]